MTATPATDLHEGAAVAATSPGSPHGSLEPGRDARGDRAADKDRLDAFNKHRRLLFAIAYRMLGSVADADDNLQETYPRWQQALASEIQSPRAFLVPVRERNAARIAKTTADCEKDSTCLSH